MKTAAVQENQEKMVFFGESRLSAVGKIPPIHGEEEARENG
jgi:hypothetical protein